MQAVVIQKLSGADCVRLSHTDRWFGMGRVLCGRIRFSNIYNRGEEPPQQGTAGEGLPIDAMEASSEAYASLRHFRVWMSPCLRQQLVAVLSSFEARAAQKVLSAHRSRAKERRQGHPSVSALPSSAVDRMPAWMMVSSRRRHGTPDRGGAHAHVTRRGDKDFEGPDEGGFCAWCGACGGPARGLMHCT